MLDEKLLRIHFDRESDIPIYQQLASQIDSLIKRGVISHSHQLPDERTWSIALGVNRLSLRKTLKVLEHSGLIVRIHGKGTFVREIINENQMKRLGVSSRCVIIATHDTIERKLEGSLRFDIMNILHQMDVETIFHNYRQHSDEISSLKSLYPTYSGIILIQTENPPAKEIVKSLKNSGVPVVGCGILNSDLKIDFAGIDSRRCFMDCTSHMIAHGHKRIMFISNNVPLFDDAIPGYLSVLEKAGIEPIVIGQSTSPPFAPTERADTNAIIQGKYEISTNIRKWTNPPTAIIVESAPLAVGVIMGLREAGISIPKDIEVISIGDNSYINAKYGNVAPPFSTIELDTPRIANEAVALLLRRVKDPKIEIKRVAIPCSMNQDSPRTNGK